MYRKITFNFIWIVNFIFTLNALQTPSSLVELEELVHRDLRLINYYAPYWVEHQTSPTNLPCYDVVIVGGGLAGLTSAFALMKLSIWNIKVFDENSEGSEGPWATYARMNTLRSPKELMGPALGTPNLTFRAWYEAQNGLDSWKKLENIPTLMWMDYLKWYRQVLDIPVENEAKLISVTPIDDYFILKFSKQESFFEVYARKVVLATGRSGFGGCEVPEFIKDIPCSFYAHSSEIIDVATLKGKTVAVIGAGASGWDSSGAALEADAAQVDILMRRPCSPNYIKFGDYYYPGYQVGLFQIPDFGRIQFIKFHLENGTPPPKETVERSCCHKNFNLISGLTISSSSIIDNQICLNTNQGRLFYDFLILATGFCVDGLQQPELSQFNQHILLWEDRPIAKEENFPKKLKLFPYLGPKFEFQEKVQGEAPYLKNLHCFNYAAFLSHGGLSIDILGISLGAQRLAEGIAADLFSSEWEHYYRLMLETVN